jgi:pimeloyl-ACP methyl ester carboxylesterase
MPGNAPAQANGDANETDTKAPDTAPPHEPGNVSVPEEADNRSENASEDAGPPEEMPEHGPDHVSAIHETINSWLDGGKDGSLGDMISDIVGGGDDAHHLVDPDAQVADWNAAVDRVRRLDGERRRIVLWGFGLGGGHAVRVAANRRVAGVVAVAPLLDGRAFARGRSPRYLARAIAGGLRDRVAAPVGRSHAVPVVGGRDEFGVLPRPTGDAYLDLIPPDSDWRNETPARGLLALFRYRPLADAANVTCPTLLIAADHDDVASPDVVADAADRIDDSTFLRLPIGHVDALGSAFETAAGHQLAFLDGVLGSR